MAPSKEAEPNRPRLTMTRLRLRRSFKYGKNPLECWYDRLETKAPPSDCRLLGFADYPGAVADEVVFF